MTNLTGNLQKCTTCHMTDAKRIQRLERVTSYPVDVVLDTDTYNEIDDQFAIAYLFANKDKLNPLALTVAPFTNQAVSTLAEGVKLSIQEIRSVLSLIGEAGYQEIYPGSESFLESESKYVDSAAARQIVKLAMQRSEDDPPLYVVGIGAITNIASAILMEPRIIERIVVVFLGGQAYFWPVNNDFNSRQDIRAARVVFGSGVPLVQLPCYGVVSSFRTTEPELRYWIGGKNLFSDYMIDRVVRQAEIEHQSGCWGNSIWDVTAVGWLLSPLFVRDGFVTSPIFEYDQHYSFATGRHLIRSAYYIDRDLLMTDLLTKIASGNGYLKS